ncbi:MAG: BolA/IbaG family iron-sulfur metabolism protein [Proteobacteria bacterium]|nr:BolA/IbaG family iron-sulfur metabolism protein [Pseudomonadota bacterium]
MPILQQDLQRLLAEKFPKAKIEITDLAGDSDHYSIHISDEIFAGKTRVAQHKIVNEALKGILGTTLHALQIKTSSNV